MTFGPTDSSWHWPLPTNHELCISRIINNYSILHPNLHLKCIKYLCGQHYQHDILMTMPMNKALSKIYTPSVSKWSYVFLTMAR